MQRKLLGCLAATCLALVGRHADAEELATPKTSVRTIDSPSTRYHVALGIADGSAVVLGASALYALDGTNHVASRDAVLGLGAAAAGTYVLGGPLVHLANGHVGRAGASLGLRTLGLLAGVGALYVADKVFAALDKRDCPDIGYDGSGTCALGTIGLYFGWTLLSGAALIMAFGGPAALDHAFVIADAKRATSQAPTVGFAVVPTKERTTATLTVSF